MWETQALGLGLRTQRLLMSARANSGSLLDANSVVFNWQGLHLPSLCDATVARGASQNPYAC
jgi:hypothetical protein